MDVDIIYSDFKHLIFSSKFDHSEICFQSLGIEIYKSVRIGGGVIFLDYESEFSGKDISVALFKFNIDDNIIHDELPHLERFLEQKIKKIRDKYPEVNVIVKVNEFKTYKASLYFHNKFNFDLFDGVIYNVHFDGDKNSVNFFDMIYRAMDYNKLEILYDKFKNHGLIETFKDVNLIDAYAKTMMEKYIAPNRVKVMSQIFDN